MLVYCLSSTLLLSYVCYRPEQQGQLDWFIMDVVFIT